MRKQNHRVLLAVTQNRENIAARFWPRVEKTNGCWFWIGARDTNGYGNVCVGPRSDQHTIKAHRVAYLLERGAIGDGLFVCHSCDTPQCVRPDHLYLGTNSQNTRDAWARGLCRNKNMLATHCIRGHEFSEENTARYRGGRSCRECNRAYCREQRRRARVAA
jgi:hypothetical protein